MLTAARAGIRAVLNALPALVGYWDSDLRNRLANDAYVEYFVRSGRQDLNLRPPGPQPEGSGRTRSASALWTGFTWAELGSVALKFHPGMHPVAKNAHRAEAAPLTILLLRMRSALAGGGVEVEPGGGAGVATSSRRARRP